jgi:CDP-2,3-bis-(O-geranylgeranyl)-sn-glycerol synthase
MCVNIERSVGSGIDLDQDQAGDDPLMMSRHLHSRSEASLNIHPVVILQLMLLLTVANGAPVIAARLAGQHLPYPLDFGATLGDGRPLFGKSKTIRGIVAAILSTSLAAMLVGLDWKLGAVVAGTAMAGDLLSSFVKRRLGLPPSSRATGLDQIPESLLPLLACQNALALSALDIAICVSGFLVGEIVLSRPLYRLHLRDRPY